MLISARAPVSSSYSSVFWNVGLEIHANFPSHQTPK